MDWRNEDDYNYTDTHSLRDWGWEFIRRNQEYLNVWQRESDVYLERMKSGDLYRDLLSFAPHVHNRSPEELRALVEKNMRFRANYLNPEDFQTFELHLDDNFEAHIWGLKTLQDPRSTELQFENSRPFVSTLYSLYKDKPTEFGIILKPNEALVILDLNAPLADQLLRVEENLRRDNKLVVPSRTNTFLRQKNWKLYLRCLDARIAKVPRKIAAPILCKNRGAIPEQAWDEAIKQANKMVKTGFKPLMTIEPR